MPNFSILLAPSEAKKPGGNPYAPDMFDYRTSNTFNYFSELNPERRKLIDALQATIEQGEDLEALFGVTGAHLEEAIQANLDIYNAPLMSALDRYSPGVMYQAMDFQGLPTGAQRRLLENGIIFSGLFGLLRPDDLIPNYRLKMDATLPGIGKVSRYWRPVISPLLNQKLAGRFVWNLLPGVHDDAWEDEHTYERMVRVKFFVEKDGERKPVTHNVKTLRGQLVNFIVRETVEDLEPLLEWEHPAGFRYDEAASTFDDDARTAQLVMVKPG
ncbi:MAG: YaaA family protein [Bacteroidetes bacterium]|nr:MAG: YaaA family protein [Bacteroidota bacterium]